MLETSLKAPSFKLARHEKAKPSTDQKRFIIKKGQDQKALGSPAKREKSPDSPPRHVKSSLSQTMAASKESSKVNERNQRLHRIKEVIKEFSGSLERQIHPKSQYDEENRNRSYLPRRFDAREMNINIPKVRQRIKENETYLHQIDSQVAGLEKEAVTRV